MITIILENLIYLFSKIYSHIWLFSTNHKYIGVILCLLLFCLLLFLVLHKKWYYRIFIFLSKYFYGMQLFSAFLISLLFCQLNYGFCDDIPPLVLDNVQKQNTDFPDLFKEYDFKERNAETIALLKIVKKCDNLSDLTLIDKKLQNYEKSYNEASITSISNVEVNDETSSFKEKLLLFVALSFGIVFIPNIFFISKILSYYFWSELAINMFLDYKINLVTRILLLEHDNWLSLQTLFCDIEATNLPLKYGFMKIEKDS